MKCPFCAKDSTLTSKEISIYCPFCGKKSQKEGNSTLTYNGPDSLPSDNNATVIKGIIPKPEQVQFSIGPYQILKSIGKGGMGEVFLAYDTLCGRKIALKRIRADLIQHTQMHSRFLREARITSQLTHPAIIPIYAIQGEKDSAFYTMPFIEGKTLRELIRAAREKSPSFTKAQEKETSIPSLTRVFLSVCQAVAYAHSKQVLHRDLKPENVIAGKYGEVLILDWGLAKIVNKEDVESFPKEDLFHSLDEEVLEVSKEPHHVTKLGKVVGTISYMAPERAKGNPATYQTDIYSLGVILYQILTLKNPFKRGSLKEFKKKMNEEVFENPELAAPYRDVPQILSNIVKKCLEKDPKYRYHSVKELLFELETYMEGTSLWIETEKLEINKKEDWEFQENILIPEHMTLHSQGEFLDWVGLMISKLSFGENVKIELSGTLGKNCAGLGFLLSVPEKVERKQMTDGFLLWVASDLKGTTCLFRYSAEVVQAKDVVLKRGENFRLRIEKRGSGFHFYMNNILQFSYVSHMPLPGTHIGMLYKDEDFILSPLHIFSAGQNVTLSCLAVPDAFLAHKYFDIALSEYRRIASSFPGRAEGREALFRAGITLLEEGIEKENPHLFEKALEEFEKLHGTPGAPLEYLGKALVYHDLKDLEEEIKCFEIGFRRYPSHPLLPVLQEQVLHRLYESSLQSKEAMYLFSLLSSKHLSKQSVSKQAKRLFRSLQKEWKEIPYIQAAEEELKEGDVELSFFTIRLSFFLNKLYQIEETAFKLLDLPLFPEATFFNALYLLLASNDFAAAKKLEEALLEKGNYSEEKMKLLSYTLEGLLENEEKAVYEILSFYPIFSFETCRSLHLLLEKALFLKKFSFLEEIQKKGEEEGWLYSLFKETISIFILAFLIQQNTEKAGTLFSHFSLEELSLKSSPLYSLYGLFLYQQEGIEIAQIHLNPSLDPSSSSSAIEHLIFSLVPHPSFVQLPPLLPVSEQKLYQLKNLFKS